MKTNTATPDFDINGFSATHIIFDNSNYATIWAKCRIANKLQEVHFVMSFDKLNDLMRFSGVNGEKIILHMVDQMMLSTAPPYMIALKDVISAEVAFTAVRLKVTATDMISPSQAYISDCLFVEEVWPINIIQQAKNLAQHTKDFKNLNIVSDAVLQTSLLQLKDMYGFYLGLMELDIAETSCRNKASLSDDRLFAMAKSSWEKG
jgi:hypothetical protein